MCAYERIKSLKIGMITPTISRLAGGLFNSVRELSRGLSASGADVQIYGGTDRFTKADSPEWSPLSISSHKIWGPPSLGIQPNLVSSISATDPDIIHLHGLWTYQSFAVSRSSLAGKPRVVSPRGMLDQWAISNSSTKKRVARFLFEDANLQNAACIHALCYEELASIRELGIKTPVAVIPNGVSIRNPTSIDCPPWRSKIPKDASVLLFLGRLHHKKGLDNLIESFGMLKSQDIGSNWHLVIAGWGDSLYIDTLLEKVASHGLSDRIHFVGSQYGDAKLACFEMADAFVLPSYSEGLPMAVLEAWSFGIPTLLTRECNLSIGFEHGVAVEVSQAPNSIANGIKEFISLPVEDRVAMGMRAKVLVEKEFDWIRISRQMLEVYDWVAGSGPKPRSVYDC